MRSFVSSAELPVILYSSMTLGWPWSMGRSGALDDWCSNRRPAGMARRGVEEVDLECDAELGGPTMVIVRIAGWRQQ